jgi:putative MFS transporter
MRLPLLKPFARPCDRTDVTDADARTDAYLRTLLLLLIAATFFEGYDGAILSLVLPGIRDTFNVPESALGISRAIIELGLGAAFFLARAGDRWGRRTLLLWSVMGYTVTTTLTAFSTNLAMFTALQSMSRVCLGAEYAVALTMIVEEFPAERRGSAIGKLLMGEAIGAVVVALLLVAGIDKIGHLQWRTLYLVGIIPLLVLAYFRRRLKETRRFEQHQITVSASGGSTRVGFWEPWRPEFRRTLVLVGLIHLLQSLPLFGATSWFFYYGEREAGIAPTFLFVIFIAAYGFGTVGYLVCGSMMERFGRRPTAIVFGLLAGASAIALFQARNTLALGALLLVAVFFGLGMAPVLGAISTELFPTYIRNQSAAWARNIFQISGFILGPLLVGVLGDHYTGALGSVGDTVSILVLLFLPATWLIWRHLPETKGRELEEIETDLGIDLTAVRISAPSGPTWRRWTIALGAVVVVAGSVVIGVRELGSVTRRPEGGAERFLQAVSSRDDKGIAKFGSEALVVDVFGTSRPPKDFDRIEVGRASPGGPYKRVPFRVEVTSHDVVEGGLVVARTADGPLRDWHVVNVTHGVPVADLRVPSEGGPKPAGAPRSAWLLAVVTVFALTLLCELLLRGLLEAAPAASRADRE